MGVDCYGWVGVNDPSLHTPSQPGFPDWWGAVVHIDDIVDRDYDAYGFFFSVYKKHPDTTIASRRGLPTQLSKEVQVKVDDPAWEMTAVTWMLWSETAVDWTGEHGVGRDTPTPPTRMPWIWIDEYGVRYFTCQDLLDAGVT